MADTDTLQVQMQVTASDETGPTMQAMSDRVTSTYNNLKQVIAAGEHPV
jgi:hypothetical protein